MLAPKSFSRIKGPNLILRLIQPKDYLYVHGLRNDPKYNRHLSFSDDTPEKQLLWIEAYKMREADFREFYYVIERMDGIRCGLVRLYNIEENNFTWGSWILDQNKTRKAALESLVLSLGVGFRVLDLTLAHIDVRIENLNAQSIYRRFGMIEQRRDKRNIYFTYTRDQFEADRAKHFAIFQGE